MLEASAKLNNSLANYELGYCYLNGYGVKKDGDKAKDFFGKSDFCLAKYELAKDALRSGGNDNALEILNGIDIKECEQYPQIEFLKYRTLSDHVQRMNLLQKSAELKYIPAQCYYGKHLIDSGEDKDKKRGEELLKKSAKQEYAAAQYYYGKHLFKTKGGRNGLQLLKKSAEQKYAAAQYYYGKHLIESGGDKKCGEELVKKSAEQKYAAAQEYLTKLQ